MSRMSKTSASYIRIADKIIFTYAELVPGNNHEFNKKNKGVPVAAVHYEKLDEYIILRDGQEQPLCIDDPKKFIRSIRRLNKQIRDERDKFFEPIPHRVTAGHPN